MTGAAPARGAIVPSRLPFIACAGLATACLALIAACSPLTGLPPVPENLTPADAGIDQLGT